MESPINYGITKTTAILRGSYSTFMIDNDLSQSDYNTYSLLSNFTAKQLKEIIDLLIKTELLEDEYVTKFQMPVLKLTEKGYLFLCGESEPNIKFVEKCLQHDLPQIADGDKDLFQQIRNLRNKIAKELEQPAYTICWGRTLFELSEKKPSTREDLNKIHGIGKTFIEKYGDRFLEIIKPYQSSLNKIDEPKGYVETKDSNSTKNSTADTVVATTIRDTPANKLFEAELIKLLTEKLTDRESKIIILRLGLGDGKARSLSDIGEIFNLSGERIRQIINKVHKKLGRQRTKINLPLDFDILEFRKDPKKYSSLYEILQNRLNFYTESTSKNESLLSSQTSEDKQTDFYLTSENEKQSGESPKVDIPIAPQISMDDIAHDDKIHIYCYSVITKNGNGAYIGGFGSILKYKDHIKAIYGGENKASLGRMDMLACIKALESIKLQNVEVTIHSTSTYLQTLFETWKSNSTMRPSYNQDLWPKFIDLLNTHDITLDKVPKPTNIKYINEARAFALKGVEQQDSNALT